MSFSDLGYSIYKGTGAAGTLNFNTVKEFDDYITSLLLNTPSGLANYKKLQSCPNLVSQDVPFLQSSLCGTFVDMAKAKYGCNANAAIKAVCKNNTASMVASLNAINNNAQWCTAGATRTTSVYYDLQIYASQGGSSTADPNNCLDAQDNEKFCGFSTSALATSWCAGKSDACCSRLSAPAPTTAAVAPPTTATPSPSNAAASSKASGSEQEGFSPVVIGSIVGGSVLLGILGFGAYYLVNRKKGDAAPAAAKVPEEQVQVAETMQVLYEYTANLFDEMTLNVGDNIIVKCKFDDGWAFGFNMNTKHEGSFPLACVAPLDYDGVSEPRDSWAYSKRASSMASTSNYNY